MHTREEIVVADPHLLKECCARLRESDVLGFDSEFVGEDTYEPSLCLIQIATADALFLIDPLTTGPLDAFWQLIVDPARTVVVHAGREEIRLCQRFSGQTPRSWFDLQVAAGLVGMHYPMGHASLVHQMLGIQLSKKETLTEWRHRPLSPSQIDYAFDDVRYLLQIWQRLDGHLAELNRQEWAKKEFTRFIAQALPEISRPPEAMEKWRKLKGIGALDRKRLAIVRELFLAREAIAAQLNRPPRVLVRDDLLIEIARRNPKSPGEIQSMRGMAKRFVQPLWDAVERARKLSPDKWPDVVERDKDLPQVALVVDLLGAILHDFCAREKLSVSLTATMSDLKDLVRSKMSNEPIADTNILITGWRKEAVLPLLLDVLEGRRGVRIKDLQAPSPFALE